jgi:hypothetical protein
MPSLEITAEEFVSKVAELLKSDEQLFMQYDIDHDQITTGSYAEGVVYKSPVLCSMGDHEYYAFNNQLRLLVPAPDRRRGLYW